MLFLNQKHLHVGKKHVHRNMKQVLQYILVQINIHMPLSPFTHTHTHWLLGSLVPNCQSDLTVYNKNRTVVKYWHMKILFQFF